MAAAYSKSPDVVFRKIADEYILVPIRNKIGDMEAIYTLNETAARAWELADGRRSIEDISKAVAGEFDVPPEDAEADIRELFAQLEGAGIVTAERR